MDATAARVMAAAEQLYAVAPAEFVARRAELSRAARRDGDLDAAGQIAALRKPSVAAWAVNHLVRVDPDVVEALTVLGESLRSAQTRLDAPELKRLRAERDRILTEVVVAAGRTAAEAGRSLAATTVTEVRDTAVAALADPAAAQAFASGTLTRALGYSGFGEVDLADAVARTGTGVALGVIRGGRSGTASDPADADPVAEAAHRAAQREGRRRAADLALHRARRDLAAADAALERARASSDGARGRLAAARAELVEAQAHDEACLVEVSEAVRARSQARAALQAAQAALAELDAQ